jgi:hypothetical protein
MKTLRETLDQLDEITQDNNLQNALDHLMRALVMLDTDQGHRGIADQIYEILLGAGYNFPEGTGIKESSPEALAKIDQAYQKK